MQRKDIFFQIYASMTRIREVELEIARRYSDGKMRCPTHLSVGQEAVPSVIAQFVNKSDYAVSTHRGHAHYLSKGGDLNSFIAEIYGKATGCSKGKGGSMHLIDERVGFMGTSAIVGNSIPVGVGLGLSIKNAAHLPVSIVYFGDGATEEGVYYESLNFAAVKSIPVIFVCENNFYSVYSNLDQRRTEKFEISNLARSLGLNSFKFDGNDPLSYYETLESLIEGCRRSREPLHLEFETYRWLEHCGPNDDDDLLYRPEKELSKWKDHDPIKKVEQYLLKNWPEEFYIFQDKYVKDLRYEINEAFRFAENSPFPKNTDAFEGEYAL